MTEQTQPTDAEILDAADDFRSQYKHGGTTFDEFDALDFARAVLARWGQPAHSGEPVATVDSWINGSYSRNYRITWHHDVTAGTKLYTAPQPVVREPLTCEWTHNDDDGYWDTSCGKAWRFDDGGPKENNMNFCHCCGKTLRIKGKEAGNAE